MAICRECQNGTLKIIGLGDMGDTILVECRNRECQEQYEVEPDGLGEGGMEFVDAQMTQLENESEDSDDEQG